MKNLLSGPSILIYILFGIIVFSFLYYAYAYVPDREKRLNEKGIRTLLNIEAGIDKKADDLTSFMAQRYDADSKTDEKFKESLNNHLYNQLRVRESSQSDSLTADSMDLKPSRNSTKVVLAKRDVVSASDLKRLTFIGEIDIVHFMKGITTNEVFQCVTLIQGNRIIYSDNPKILQAHAMTGIYKPPVDSMGITIEKVVVNNKDYFQFTNRVHLGPTPVYIAGYIAKEDYNRYTDEIPFLLLFFLVLLTSLTFSTFPIIKIFVIGKWERLQASDYVYAGIGLIFSLYILGAGIYAGNQWRTLENDTYDKLQVWNAHIQKNFQVELDAIFKILKSPEGWSSKQEIIYHEIFTYSTVVKDQKEEGFKSLKLPFEKSLVDASRLEFYVEHSQVGNREYIKRLKEPTFAYELNGTKFYIESVFSFSRAAREAVISSLSDSIRAISTDLKSMMLYTPPRGYDYCLIDREGQVIFSSRDSHNNLNNVFESFSNADFINQSILNSKAGKGRFNYGRSGFHGYISPVSSVKSAIDKSTPLFLLTYHNESILEWQILATAIHSASIMFLLICAIFLIRILLGISHYFKKANIIFGQKKGFMSYVFPNKDSRADYIVLGIAALGMMVVVLIWTIGQSVNSSLVIWCTGITLYLILQYSILTDTGKWFTTLKGKLQVINNGNFMIIYCFFVISWFSLVLLSPASVFLSKSRGAVELSYTAMVQDEIKEENRKNTLKLHEKYDKYSQISSDAKTFKSDSLAIEFKYLQSGNNLQQLLVLPANTVNTNTATFDFLRWTFDFLNPSFGIAPHPFENKKGADIPISLFFFIISLALITLVVLKMFNNVPRIFREKPGELGARLEIIANKFNQSPLRVILVGVPGSKRSAHVETLLDNISKKEKLTPEPIDLFRLGTSEEIKDAFAKLNNEKVLVIKDWMPQGMELPLIERFNSLYDILNDPKFEKTHIFLYASQSISSLENYFSETIKTNKKLATQINDVREVMIRFMHQFHQINVPIKINLFSIGYESNVRDEMYPAYAKKQFFAPKYNSIWNSLSLPERFLLYDLAEDGVVNLTDKTTLGMLYLKGLVVYNPKTWMLDCFDDGFSLFVRQGISTKDLIEIEQNAKKLGRWQGVRLGLLLIAVSLVGFVYIINPNVLQGLIGVAGGIAALTASVGKITSNFKIPNLAGILGRNNSSE